MRGKGVAPSLTERVSSVAGLPRGADGISRTRAAGMASKPKYLGRGS